MMNDLSMQDRVRYAQEATQPTYDKYSELFDKSQHLVLRTFTQTVEDVPAYSRYLEKHLLPIKSISQVSDFVQLPVMDKDSYIRTFKLSELFPNNKIPDVGHSSSGSSGKKTFWFRGKKQDIIAANIIDYIFKKIFQLNSDESTLVIISFAMGIWIAGTHVLLACNRLLNQTNNHFTLLTPGGEINDVLSILEELAPSFKNIVLFGYPPLISRIFSEAALKKIDIKNTFYLITSGGNFSEEWRDHMLNTLHLPEEKAHHIISMYGSADAGIMGHETPLTIHIRRLMRNNAGFRQSISGSESHYLPLLAQYHPDKIYFESINQELVLTANLDLPLIRYNIKDMGSVYLPHEILNKLKVHHLHTKEISHLFEQWDLPLISVRGRSDVAINFNCAKIPIEFLLAAIQSDKNAHYLSGYILAYTQPISRGEIFHIELEVAEGICLTEIQKLEITSHIFLYLQSVCTEYNYICEKIGTENAFPHFNFLPFKQNRRPDTDHKIQSPKILGIPGKKPCVIF